MEEIKQEYGRLCAQLGHLYFQQDVGRANILSLQRQTDEVMLQLGEVQKKADELSRGEVK